MSEINEQTRTVDPELLAVPEIREAIELSEEAAYTKEELAGYDLYWDTVSLEKTLLAEREAFGEMKGKIEGRIEGKMDVAKNLLAEGLSMAIMTKVTGLSETEIKSLQD